MAYRLMTRARLPVAFVLGVALSACALPVAQTGADLALPARWQSPSVRDAPAVTAQWWRSFGSAELTSLVDTAQHGSFDVAQAVARVHQADAQVRISGAALMPQVAASVTAERERTVGYPAYGNDSGYLTASYELDLWGANRAARQASVDTLAAAAAARDAMVLTLTADVANTYVQVLALRERAAIARDDLDAGQRLLAFIESQYRAGAALAGDVAQQKTLVAQLRQTVEQYDQQENEYRIALATLAGLTASEVQVREASLEALAVPAIGAGFPSDLVTRRPDVAEAERALAAADANVTVARAAMLPTLTLTADLGVGSTRLAGLFDHPIYDLAAGLSAPVFNAGRLAAGRDLAMAQREELLAAYRSAIVSALGDVETALSAINGIDARRRAQEEVIRQAATSMQQADSRYRAGAETLQTLLDAQRTLYAARDMAVQLKLLRLQASVALYKALGGGWQADAARGGQSVALRQMRTIDDTHEAPSR